MRRIAPSHPTIRASGRQRAGAGVVGLVGGDGGFDLLGVGGRRFHVAGAGSGLRDGIHMAFGFGFLLMHGVPHFLQVDFGMNVTNIITVTMFCYEY